MAAVIHSGSARIHTDTMTGKEKDARKGRLLLIPDTSVRSPESLA